MKKKHLIGIMAIMTVMAISTFAGSADWSIYTSTNGTNFSTGTRSVSGTGTDSVTNPWSSNTNYIEVQQYTMADLENAGDASQYLTFNVYIGTSNTYEAQFDVEFNGVMHVGDNNPYFAVIISSRPSSCSSCTWLTSTVYSKANTDYTFSQESHTLTGLQTTYSAGTTYTFRILFKSYTRQNTIAVDTGYVNFSGTNYLLLKSFTLYISAASTCGVHIAC